MVMVNGDDGDGDGDGDGEITIYRKYYTRCLFSVT